MARAVIFGCAGTALSTGEAAFLRGADPYGFILFKRNVDTPDQVRRLVGALRDCVGRDAAVLIDQEGGRVQRLCPPHWRGYAPAWTFVEMHRTAPQVAAEALTLSAGLMAADLAALGIDVDCVPLLDVRQPDTHDAIGNRALGGDPDTVIALARVQLDAVEAAGVNGVIKHMPGHGRARVDSHDTLPRVDAGRAELDAVDFAPFTALAKRAVYGMTGHLLFPAIDAERPSTLSPMVIGEVIREHMGFDGLLMTDDLSMGALGGTLTTRAERAITAGCDVILHCNGVMEQMAAVAEVTPVLAGSALARAERADAARLHTRRAGQAPSDDAGERLDALLAAHRVAG
ncbi:MAG: beta-N-acetylhexosaminidase [Alphaproteobacteria bacterium]|nr:beta-N-acetylhexosaminidase [Alphaproteobacteria bacterium]